MAEFATKINALRTEAVQDIEDKRTKLVGSICGVMSFHQGINDAAVFKVIDTFTRDIFAIASQVPSAPISQLSRKLQKGKDGERAPHLIAAERENNLFVAAVTPRVPVRRTRDGEDVSGDAAETSTENEATEALTAGACEELPAVSQANLNEGVAGVDGNQ